MTLEELWAEADRVLTTARIRTTEENRRVIGAAIRALLLGVVEEASEARTQEAMFGKYGQVQAIKDRITHLGQEDEG